MPTWTPETFAKRLDGYTRERKKQLKAAALDVAQQGVAEGVAIATALPVFDRGIYAQRFRAVKTRKGAELRNDAPHAAVIEFGRRPGARPPPVAVIEAWIRRKGIDVSRLAAVRKGRRKMKNGKGRTKGRKTGTRAAQRQLAFLIARSIGKKGIKPQAVFRKHLIPKVRRRWRAEVRRILALKV